MAEDADIEDEYSPTETPLATQDSSAELTCTFTTCGTI